jgi:hypothetical protein
MTECEWCHHPDSAHCAGKVFHTGWKNNEPGHVCVGRHCNYPLCSCVELILAPRKPVARIFTEQDRAVAVAASINPFRPARSK